MDYCSKYLHFLLIAFRELLDTTVAVRLGNIEYVHILFHVAHERRLVHTLETSEVEYLVIHSHFRIQPSFLGHIAKHTRGLSQDCRLACNFH